ncbi:hypothetical protein E4O93_04815 [Diaphorobacter sp. DS2]|nr:hypothetical protein E4O93_04815 [Diaphorobacter sp. DS2]
MLNKQTPEAAANTHAVFAANFGKANRQFQPVLNMGGIEFVGEAIYAENAYEAKSRAAEAYQGCRVVDMIIH